MDANTLDQLLTLENAAISIAAVDLADGDLDSNLTLKNLFSTLFPLDDLILILSNATRSSQDGVISIVGQCDNSIFKNMSVNAHFFLEGDKTAACIGFDPYPNWNLAESYPILAGTFLGDDLLDTPKVQFATQTRDITYSVNNITQTAHFDEGNTLFGDISMENKLAPIADLLQLQQALAFSATFNKLENGTQLLFRMHYGSLDNPVDLDMGFITLPYIDLVFHITMADAVAPDPAPPPAIIIKFDTITKFGDENKELALNAVLDLDAHTATIEFTGTLAASLDELGSLVGVDNLQAQMPESLPTTNSFGLTYLHFDLTLAQQEPTVVDRTLDKAAIRIESTGDAWTVIPDALVLDQIVIDVLWIRTADNDDPPEADAEPPTYPLTKITASGAMYIHND